MKNHLVAFTAAVLTMMMFQNCAPVSGGSVAGVGAAVNAFSGDGITTVDGDDVTTVEGDDGYHGGGERAPLMFQNVTGESCTDGSKFRATLKEISPGTFALVRDNCKDIDPIAVAPSELTADASGTIRIYKGRLFQKGYRADQRILLYCRHEEVELGMNAGATRDTNLNIDATLTLYSNYDSSGDKFHLAVSQWSVLQDMPRVWSAIFATRSGDVYSGNGDSLTGPRNQIDLTLTESTQADLNFQFEYGAGTVGSRKLATGRALGMNCFRP